MDAHQQCAVGLEGERWSLPVLLFETGLERSNEKKKTAGSGEAIVLLFELIVRPKRINVPFLARLSEYCYLVDHDSLQRFLVARCALFGDGIQSFFRNGQ